MSANHIITFLLGCTNGLNYQGRWQELYHKFREQIYDFFLKQNLRFNYINKGPSGVYQIVKGNDNGIRGNMQLLHYPAAFTLNKDNLPQYFFLSENNHIYFFIFFKTMINGEEKIAYIDFDASGNSHYVDLEDIFSGCIEGDMINMLGEEEAYFQMTKNENEIINHFYSNDVDNGGVNYQEQQGDYCCSIYTILVYYLAISIFENHGDLNIFLGFLSTNFLINGRPIQQLLQEFVVTVYNYNMPQLNLVFQEIIQFVAESQGVFNAQQTKVGFRKKPKLKNKKKSKITKKKSKSNFIINPETGRKVKRTGKKGKELIKKYNL